MTGVACRRSRRTTSIPKHRGRTSKCSSAQRRRPARNSSNVSRSIRRYARSAPDVGGQGSADDPPAQGRCRRLAAHRRLVAGNGGRGAACCAAIGTVDRSRQIAPILARVAAGRPLEEQHLVRLFQARGDEFAEVCAAADALRREASGDVISYVVCRNINYTNVCYFKCQFCAFSKGKLSENLRGRPYTLSLDEIARRAREAWDRGATEVCMQGGIEPSFTGQTYLEICAAVRQAAPGMHVHAFSPLEVHQGAATLGVPVGEFLATLKEAGLGTLPGTAAEILDDEVRAVLCPDKIGTDRWLDVMRTAHRSASRRRRRSCTGTSIATSTGRRHLLRIRELQVRDRRLHGVRAAALRSHGGAHLSQGARATRTDVPRSGLDARGREAGAAPGPHEHSDIVGEDGSGRREGLPRIWRQRSGRHADGRDDHALGRRGARSGDDAGRMEAIIRAIGRIPRQRTTLYGDAPEERYATSFAQRRDETSKIVLTACT